MPPKFFMTAETDLEAEIPSQPSAAPPPAARRWWLDILVAAGLALVTLLLYSRVVVEDYQFLYYDDHDYVFNNPHVSSGLTWTGARWAFSPKTRVSSNWHPLTLLSHMLDCEVYGLKAWGHHLTNLLWHTANVLLLFGVLRTMTGALWRSAVVAALFGWHPLHVESVAWVAERKDLLCAFFWFLGTWFYVGYARRGGVFYYLAVTLCLGLGLLSKPMIVTFPFTLLLLDYWPLGRFTLQAGKSQDAGAQFGRLLLEKLPWILLVVVGCLVTLEAQETAYLSWERMTLSERLINSTLSYNQYLLKMLWPTRLATPYLLDEEGLRWWQGAVAFLPLALITALAVGFRRRLPYVPVGWFWYLGTLVPVIGIIQVGVQAWADRYTYIPLVGIFIIFAWGLHDLVAALPALRRPVAAALVLLLALLTVLTYHQLGYWRDTIVLLRHTVDITGTNGPAQYGLASAYRAEHRYDECLAECDRIIAKRPDFFDAYYMRGRALRETGRHAEAAAAFAEALNQAQGKMDMRRSIQLSITAARVYAAHLDAAVRHAQKAVTLAEFACKITHYSDAEVLDTLAAAYAEAGRFSEAAARAQTALELAVETGQTELAQRISGRLDLYRRNQPFRWDPNNEKF